MTETIKIILTDDHAIVRNGVKALLESDARIKVIDEANNGQEALDKIKQLEPDIVIMDIRMPVMNGIEATKELSKLNVKTKALILSMHDTEEYVLQSIECGAHGYLLKDAEESEFIKAIYKIYNGGRHFSSSVSNILVENYLQGPRSIQTASTSTDSSILESLTKKELEILKLIKDGLTNQEISESLGKSVRTVETHRFNMMKKLQVKNLIELINKTATINF